MPGSGRNRARIAALIVSASSILAAVALAQTPPDQGARTNDRVPVELFQGPRPKSVPLPDCGLGGRLGDRSGACESIMEGFEGWVELSMMVDPQGKPFEIAVIRSTGNRTFDAFATKAVEQSTFEPASLDGKPIESGFEFKYRFVNSDSQRNPGATGDFIRQYKTLLSAINASDRAAADTALGKLKITNLYEDAYFGLATFDYAAKWGDESQQLGGLRRAIAEEDLAQYLPKDLFQFALLQCMRLEVSAHYYAEALTTWQRLQKGDLDKSTQAKLQPVVDQLQQLRSDHSAFEVAGVMPEGQWFLHLFKRHFQAEVSGGLISQVKLRCDKRYVFFSFDPKMEYQVANADGKCSVELEGTPGTKFKFVQF